MCRIAGVLNRTLPSEKVLLDVSEMCDLQKHGGPDDSGIYICPETNLTLGHRRLSIIDLSNAGHQPMMYDERYVISFNGEIYNFKELKQELLHLGKIFKTESDTEVIMAAFSQWNIQSFAKLSGMFAFALYDKIDKELYLVRDPSGIKPLYYCSTNSKLEFASEIRAFKALGKTENKEWPVYQLAYGHIPEPVTTLSDVLPLQKGFFYKYNTVTGTNSLQTFFQYSYSNIIEGDVNIQTIIRNIFKQSVGRHLLSDAPIGVFLSGGIDSGIIATLASEFQNQHLKTLSLFFNEKSFSEKIYQDKIIENLHCDHYQHMLTEEEFYEALPGLLKDMDMPSCDGLNTWFISKYANIQGLKAVLSGIGADELFGGYPSFRRINIAISLQRSLSSILKLTNLGNLKEIRRLPFLSINGVKGLYLFLRGHFIPVDIARQLGSTEKEVWEILNNQPVISNLSFSEPKNCASWIELNMYMQNQLLRDADIMSMAHGVEIRVPFLDHEMIKASLSFKASDKYKGPLPKQILIDTFKDILPELIWNRKKMGFSFPFSKWLMNSNFVKDTFSGSNSRLNDNYKKFISGQLHWSQLMSLLILQNRLS